ncbi:MAG: GNAT family N-acetyltransferase, partial [Chloroflexi bacterium]|nr:GNAT family N-acetyltransferase [Chloroflexota bacterium]
ITDARTGQFLGGCGLNGLDPTNRRANLFYWVRSSATGRGVATAAVKLLARYGFERMELLRIEILVEVGNDASKRVAEKSGARFEGTLRNRLYHQGRVRDSYLFSLILSDLT